jgi:beta-lactamase regulating signal transducer with metallopeptidase domain
MVSTMTEMGTLLQQPAAQVIGWALLHFLWQGALVGGLTAVALAALRRSAADVRYVVGSIGLSLMLTLPAVTAVQLWRADAPGTPPPTTPVTAAIVETAPASASVPAMVLAADHPSATVARTSGFAVARLERWLPVLVFGWLCGVALLTLRLMSGWMWVRRMKSHGASPAADGWQHIVARLSRRLHIARRVRLLESTLVDVPTVIGWVKPVVLLPASALAGLSPQQLEAILAHELAHIRRHDYLVNLLQTLVETLLFYHPAVWWLSRRIRVERENCCDDLAVSLCGDPYTYAKALADLEALRGSVRPQAFLAMAASGGSLVQRVRRLLGAPSHAGRPPGWLAASATILVMIAIAAGAAGTDAFQSAAASTGAARADAQASTPPRRAEAPRPAPQASTPPPRAEAALKRPAPPAVREPVATTLRRGSSSRATATKVEQRRAKELAALSVRIRSIASRYPGNVEEQLRSAAEGGLSALALSAAFADFMETIAAMDAARASTMPVLAAVGFAPMDGASTRPMLARAPQPVTRFAARTVTFVPAAVQASRGRQRTMSYSWSNDGEKLEVKLQGEIQFTDDDTDVKTLSPGGSLRIRDGGWFATHTLHVTADGSGNLTRRFWKASTERPFDPDGRQWLAKMLPRFIRQSGIGAPARAARILDSKGAAGVLAEISLIEGSWGKKVYFKELLKTPLDPATVRQLLLQAGREVDSDFELASLLIDSADTLLVDQGTRQAYLDAARTIQSDFEQRRVFASLLKRGPLSPQLLSGILEASRIESDFEEASLLIQIAQLQSLDSTTRGPFFSALGTVGSDFEHRRVLSALAGRPDITAETATAMLVSSAAIASDFEAASFLLQIARQHAIEGALRAPFFRTLESIGSTFERGRVLQAVVRRADASEETVLSALRATAGMGSSFEAGQVLLAVAATHPLTSAARDVYIDAAGKLGDFEQGKALSALVRNERRR